MTKTLESRRSPGTHVLNVVRGGLIGTAEVVPGVSGGTIALVVGVYDTLIISAGHVLSGIKNTVADLPRGRGMARANAEFRRADWLTIGAVLVGMLLAVLLAAKLIAPLVESNQQRAYAVFFGLVLASLWVPYSRSGSWSAKSYLVFLVAAVAAFVLTGLPPNEIEPNPLIVLLAAAVAICALVLPGVSGSFILLTFGLYTVTMNAVNERDIGYLGTFFLGALIGLAVFVKLLQWLLEHHHHTTLVVMTGLMAGSLRALWPWQGEDRALHLPTTDVPMTVGLGVIGFVVVVVVMLIERKASARNAAANVPERPAGN